MGIAFHLLLNIANNPGVARSGGKRAVARLRNVEICLRKQIFLLGS